jgi:hypothetical protein
MTSTTELDYLLLYQYIHIFMLFAKLMIIFLFVEVLSVFCVYFVLCDQLRQNLRFKKLLWIVEILSAV